MTLYSLTGFAGPLAKAIGSSHLQKWGPVWHTTAFKVLGTGALILSSLNFTSGLFYWSIYCWTKSSYLFVHESLRTWNCILAPYLILDRLVSHPFWVSIVSSPTSIVVHHSWTNFFHVINPTVGTPLLLEWILAAAWVIRWLGCKNHGLHTLPPSLCMCVLCSPADSCMDGPWWLPGEFHLGSLHYVKKNVVQIIINLSHQLHLVLPNSMWFINSCTGPFNMT